MYCKLSVIRIADCPRGVPCSRSRRKINASTEENEDVSARDLVNSATSATVVDEGNVVEWIDYAANN